MKKDIPIKKHVLAGVALIVLALIVFIPSRSGGNSSAPADDSSASGTYYWSSGPLEHSITLMGDEWYADANFDVLTHGRIRGNTLYDESGFVPVGQIVNSKTIRYSGTTLRKE